MHDVCLLGDDYDFTFHLEARHINIAISTKNCRFGVIKHQSILGESGFELVFLRGRPC